jgi:hydroxyethylthiazole kinase-like uncharacterized protein yjeF
MQNLYLNVSPLDQRSVTKFALSEEVMMEHAALAMANVIRARFAFASSILIVCGSGNNGADGLALARLLEGDYHVCLHIPFGASSPLAHLQRNRAEAFGLKHAPLEGVYDVVVDALFGSGLNRTLGPTAIEALLFMNQSVGYKIACDVPSGLYAEGTLDKHIFSADIAVTMKPPLYGKS